MKISLNWLKKYVDIKVSNEELVRLIGARLVEVEGVIDETHKYDNIYVVRVEKVEKISGTHLALCQINVGDINISKAEKNSDGLVQVVCGAPNVHEGMLAVWIAPGAVVPASVNEDAPFVIGKRKMLGKYESNGMLAGADELDFDDKHEKIVEIDTKMAKPGDKLADVFELNDLILDIENKSLTHRPDCFGIIGFAREVAGILGQKFNNPEFLFKEKVFPEGFLIKEGDCLKSKDLDFEVKIVDSKICPRYTGAIIKISDAVSEEKYLSNMQIYLAKSGMMTKTKIVDVTNYLMLLTGQPLHAFDYDKFLAVGKSNKPVVIVRNAKNGEKITLLDGKEIECVESDILITSNDVPVALAGAMGGISTVIDENTKNVLLESASFSLYNLRKTQMAHGIFSEAITRFTKGVPATETFNVLAEAVKEINGKPISLYDDFPGVKIPEVIKITVKEINSLLGTNYDKKLVKDTLENVGFVIKNEQEELEIIPPIWRTDIHIKEDIIEEVGRLLGYDNIEPILPLHQTASQNQMWNLKKQVRNIMRRLGANELLTYSFVSERLLKKANQDTRNSYKIVNSISPELQFIRQSIAPSLLEKAYMNQKIPFDKFAFYEMNKVYQKEWGMNDEGVPVEKMQMGFVLAERKSKGTAYYKAKKYVEELLNELGVAVDFKPAKGEMAVSKPFESKRTADIITKNGEFVGVVGEFKNSVRQEFKLAEYLAGFEINLDKLLMEINNKREIYLGKIEKRDLTIKTDKKYADIVDRIKKILSKYNLEVDITPASIYRPIGADKNSISVHLEFHGDFDSSVMQELEKI